MGEPDLPALEPPADRPIVLVVDDTPENLQLMHGLLRNHYRVRLANCGEVSLELARTCPQPDLILLDIMMPGIDGYEVCRRLKADPLTQPIPVIFLTARDHASDQQQGFACGCVDYITKPISPPLALARVSTHIALKRANDQLTDNNRYLQQELERRTREVQTVQDVTIMAMASLAETRDNETGSHIHRTQNYVRALARHLAADPRYAPELSEEAIDQLYKSAPLHDIGKVGISDGVLLKPGRLSPQEFELMKEHVLLGDQIIASAERLLDTPSSFLRFAREIARHHHENWDGSGYPDGLAGTAIPLSARLMAVADVYDALISKRCYKEPYSHQVACDFIVKASGRKFDPVIVEAFCQLSDQFRAVADQFRDCQPEAYDQV
ncbi:MAG: HD domain-containing phosphohydrolase [Cyanobacteriota bacterium]